MLRRGLATGRTRHGPWRGWIRHQSAGAVSKRNIFFHRTQPRIFSEFSVRLTWLFQMATVMCPEGGNNRCGDDQPASCVCGSGVSTEIAATRSPHPHLGPSPPPPRLGPRRPGLITGSYGKWTVRLSRCDQYFRRGSTLNIPIGTGGQVLKFREIGEIRTRGSSRSLCRPEKYPTGRPEPGLSPDRCNGLVKPLFLSLN